MCKFFEFFVLSTLCSASTSTGVSDTTESRDTQYLGGGCNSIIAVQNMSSPNLSIRDFWHIIFGRRRIPPQDCACNYDHRVVTKQRYRARARSPHRDWPDEWLVKQKQMLQNQKGEKREDFWLESSNNNSTVVINGISTTAGNIQDLTKLRM